METICPLCGECTPVEPDAEWVYCIHCYRRIVIDPADVGDVMAQIVSREQLLEKLLHDCVMAIDALLASPDLNRDWLEPTTRAAIEVARETLQASHEA